MRPHDEYQHREASATSPKIPVVSAAGVLDAPWPPAAASRLAARLDARQAERLTLIRREAMYRLALAAQVRHRHLVGHLERVAQYSALLAESAGKDPSHCRALLVASCLHDVGKIGIPDRILDKPGPLMPAERGVLERHTLIGHALLADSADEQLELAATIALTHHERVDGSGYPHRLAGDRIPVAARMVAIADTFDALTSDRPYRPRRSFGEAVRVLQQGRGTQFDGALLEHFLDVLPEVAAIAEKGPDGHMPLVALIGLDRGSGSGDLATTASETSWAAW
jgi:putative two-component system response regulator